MKCLLEYLYEICNLANVCHGLFYLQNRYHICIPSFTTICSWIPVLKSLFAFKTVNISECCFFWNMYGHIIEFHFAKGLSNGGTTFLGIAYQLRLSQSWLNWPHRALASNNSITWKNTHIARRTHSARTPASQPSRGGGRRAGRRPSSSWNHRSGASRVLTPINTQS